MDYVPWAAVALSVVTLLAVGIASWRTKRTEILDRAAERALTAVSREAEAYRGELTLMRESRDRLESQVKTDSEQKTTLLREVTMLRDRTNFAPVMEMMQTHFDKEMAHFERMQSHFDALAGGTQQVLATMVAMEQRIVTGTKP